MVAKLSTLPRRQGTGRGVQALIHFFDCITKDSLPYGPLMAHAWVKGGDFIEYLDIRVPLAEPVKSLRPPPLLSIEKPSRLPGGNDAKSNGIRAAQRTSIRLQNKADVV